MSDTFSVSGTASVHITRNDRYFGYSITEVDQTILSGTLSIQPRKDIPSRKIAFMVIRHVRDSRGILLGGFDANQARWRTENMHNLDRIFKHGFSQGD